MEALWDRLFHSMRLRGHTTGFMLETLAGVDIALWDLAGKRLGQPIYKLLGGPFHAANEGPLRVPCYASGLSGTTLEERQASLERCMGLGFSTVKMSIGRGSREDDLVQVGRARSRSCSSGPGRSTRMG